MNTEMFALSTRDLSLLGDALSMRQVNRDVWMMRTTNGGLTEWLEEGKVNVPELHDDIFDLDSALSTNVPRVSRMAYLDPGDLVLAYSGSDFIVGAVESILIDPLPLRPSGIARRMQWSLRKPLSEAPRAILASIASQDEAAGKLGRMKYGLIDVNLFLNPLLSSTNEGGESLGYIQFMIEPRSRYAIDHFAFVTELDRLVNAYYREILGGVDDSPIEWSMNVQSPGWLRAVSKSLGKVSLIGVFAVSMTGGKIQINKDGVDIEAPGLPALIESIEDFRRSEAENREMLEEKDDQYPSVVVPKKEIQEVVDDAARAERDGEKE